MRKGVPRPNPLTKEQIERVQELYQAGRSTQQIVADLGRSTNQVLGALKRLGLKPAGAKEGACYRNADQIRAWAAEGVSLSEIGRRIGTKHQLVATFLRKHGIERKPFHQSGENNPAWRGGRMTDKAGYVLIHMPDHPSANRHGYVREHRWVMEQTLGRFLGRQEVVHHKDGDPQNNDPSNLEVFENNALHLAETLKGQCPNWTDDGFRRIQERWNRLGDERRASTRSRDRGQDGRPSPGMSDRKAS